MNAKRFFVFFGLVALITAFIVLYGSESSAAPAKAVSGAKKIEVPKTGTAAERTKKLWQTIRPIMLADAKANLSDSDYIERGRSGSPLWDAWRELEWDTAESSSDTVSQFHRKIWMLMGDLYGDKGTRPDYRQKVREETKRKIDNKLADLDKMAETIK